MHVASNRRLFSFFEGKKKLSPFTYKIFTFYLRWKMEVMCDSRMIVTRKIRAQFLAFILTTCVNLGEPVKTCLSHNVMVEIK